MSRASLSANDWLQITPSKVKLKQLFRFINFSSRDRDRKVSTKPTSAQLALITNIPVVSHAKSSPPAKPSTNHPYECSDPSPTRKKFAAVADVVLLRAVKHSALGVPLLVLLMEYEGVRGYTVHCDADPEFVSTSRVWPSVLYLVRW
ncbi:hypothetical protein GQ600_26156 [Phytophthora cactorum]|nr:hypothetical protein GQ600_26156 [Phytophthora cactorum]